MADANNTLSHEHVVSRRSAIKSVASGAAVITAGALATTAIAATRDADPILPLYQRWRALVDESEALRLRYHEVEQTIPWRLRIERGDYGEPWPDTTDLPEFEGFASPVGIKRPSLTDVRNTNRSQTWHLEFDDDGPMPVSAELLRRRAEGRTRIRAWIRRYREQRAAYEVSGCNAIDRKRDASIDELLVVYDQLCRLTPITRAGAAALLRLAAHYGVRAGDIDHVEEMAGTCPMTSVLRFLEGGAS